MNSMERSFLYQEIITGKNGEIKLTFSIVKQSVRLEGGGSSIGKMALSNQGVSVVRAGRELEINKSFENSYDPRERWWGVEVRFDPVFDEVFGVTNNKQMATNFYKLDYASLAEGEDITVAELKTLLEEDHDSRKIIIDISTKIDSVLQTIKNQIKKQREGIKQTENANDSSSHTPENIGSTIVKERKNDNPSPSDLQEDEIPLVQKKEELEGIIEDSLNINDPQDREAIIQKWLSNKFIVLSKSLPVASFFDVSFPAGKIQITINSEHSAFQYFFEKLEDENHEIYQILKLILMAWGRMEDEAQGNRERKRLLQDLRYDWGKIARDMIERYEE